MKKEFQQKLPFSKSQTENKYHVGIDGGGTKTHAIIIDENGNKFEGFAKGSNPNKVGVSESTKNIFGSIENAITTNNLSINLSNISNAVLGIAGIGLEEDKQTLTCKLEEYFKIIPFQLMTDADIALYSVTGGSKPAIIQIAGTGAITLGLGTNKQIARSDGFGNVYGDKGSGYYIGKKAIEKVLRVLDRTDLDNTRLTDRCFSYFGVNNLEQLRKAISPDKFNPAHFAKIVAETANIGDSVATDIVRQASFHIVASIKSVIDKLDLRRQSFEIGLCGSIFKTGDVLIQPIERLVQEYAQRAVFLPELINPAFTASLMAKNRI